MALPLKVRMLQKNTYAATKFLLLPPLLHPPMNLHENTRQDSLSLSQGEERRKSSKGGGRGGTAYENYG